MAIAISIKPIGPFDNKLFFFVILFTSVLSVPHRPDTKAKLNAYDQLNLFLAEFGEQVTQYEVFETAGKILENPVADMIGIKSATESALNVTQTLPLETVSNADDSVCYDDLGCITRFSFADPFLWPINLLPEPRNQIDTHFTLNTRDRNTPPPGIPISAYDASGIAEASFKASRPTKFYIHGWLSTGYEDLYTTFVQRLLANGDFNVIVVHWGGGAFTSYNQAYVNIRLVGLEIAFLVNTLIGKFGVEASDVHLIGHSFGAHTSGYAGEKIPNLGRITGLDPAGWYYRGMPTFVRLDPSDAQFVDAVHTDGDGAFAIGLSEPVGHVDFYPNGGGNQPGCLLSEFPTAINLINSNTNYSSIDINAACSHMRAVDLYSESLLSKDCQTIGFKCSDYESFAKGQCTSCGSDNSRCSPFGLQAISYPIGNQVNVKFYFNTGDSFPFCRYHYGVNVRLANPSVAKPTVSGILKLSISGQAGSLSNVKLPAYNLKHGSDRQFLLTVPTNLGPVQRVNLRWKYVATNFLELECFLGFCNQRLYVNSVTISSLNNYPDENIKINTYKNCPQFTPGVIGQHFSLDLSVVNSCSTRFHLLDYI